jgi:hypothetical protein
MKLANITEVNNFLRTVDECTGDVWLESVDGDKINLKSKLSQYVAITALISCESDKLELFCSKHEDEERFFKFFKDNPMVL